MGHDSGGGDRLRQGALNLRASFFAPLCRTDVSRSCRGVFSRPVTVMLSPVTRSSALDRLFFDFRWLTRFFSLFSIFHFPKEKGSWDFVRSFASVYLVAQTADRFLPSFQIGNFDVRSLPSLPGRHSLANFAPASHRSTSSTTKASDTASGWSKKLPLALLLPPLQLKRRSLRRHEYTEPQSNAFVCRLGTLESGVRMAKDPRRRVKGSRGKIERKSRVICQLC
jgi:hypothetical protein